MPPKTATLKIDLIFRALSDRTRLRILNLLLNGELCVCDLVDVLEAPQPTVSRHLAYLRKAGLAVARKEGQWSYYRLLPAQSEFHERLVDCLRACRDEAPQLSRDIQTLRERGCSDCCN